MTRLISWRVNRLLQTSFKVYLYTYECLTHIAMLLPKWFRFSEEVATSSSGGGCPIVLCPRCLYCIQCTFWKPQPTSALNMSLPVISRRLQLMRQLLLLLLLARLVSSTRNLCDAASVYCWMNERAERLKHEQVQGGGSASVASVQSIRSSMHAPPARSPSMAGQSVWPWTQHRTAHRLCLAFA